MLKIFIFMMCSFFAGIFVEEKFSEKEDNIKRYQEEIQKTRYYLRIATVWIDMLQHKKNITDYLKQNGYQRIAIYGMKDLGERLYHELCLGGIEPVCVIDRSEVMYGEIPIYRPDDELPELDLIIVTAEYYLETISRSLEHYNVEIVGISGIIGNAYGRNIC